MPIEGMVDALSRARRWLRPYGVLIDLRPATELVARVSVGTAAEGWTDTGTLDVEATRRTRYAAADGAVATALDRRWFALQSERTFDFSRYADSPDELRDYIAAKWRETRMGPQTHARAVESFRAQAGMKVRLTERLVIRQLAAAR